MKYETRKLLRIKELLERVPLGSHTGPNEPCQLCLALYELDELLSANRVAELQVERESYSVIGQVLPRTIGVSLNPVFVFEDDPKHRHVFTLSIALLTSLHLHPSDMRGRFVRITTEFLEAKTKTKWHCLIRPDGLRACGQCGYGQPVRIPSTCGNCGASFSGLTIPIENFSDQLKGETKC